MNVVSFKSDDGYGDDLEIARLLSPIIDALVVAESHGYTTNSQNGMISVFRPAGKRLYGGPLTDVRRFENFTGNLPPDVAYALSTVRQQLLRTPGGQDPRQNLTSPIRRIDLLAPNEGAGGGEIQVVLASLAIMYTVGRKISLAAMPKKEFLAQVSYAEKVVLSYSFASSPLPDV